MSRNKTFTGPLAEHIQNFLNEKRSLGYKYEEQERILYVLDKMSKQFDCSTGLPEELCMAFAERDPNWRQRTQEHRVTLIRTFAEYLIRHEIPAHLVDFSIVTNRNEDFKPYIFTHSQITDIFMPQIPSARILLIRIFFIPQFCVFSMVADFEFQKLLGFG